MVTDCTCCWPANDNPSRSISPMSMANERSMAAASFARSLTVRGLRNVPSVISPRAPSAIGVTTWLATYEENCSATKPEPAVSGLISAPPIDDSPGIVPVRARMCDRALSSGPITGIGIVFGGGGTVRSSVPRWPALRCSGWSIRRVAATSVSAVASTMSVMSICSASSEAAAGRW